MKFMLLTTLISVAFAVVSKQRIHAENSPSIEKILDKPLFEGVYAASLTPMLPDFSCDYEELAHHCKDLMNRGCSGVVLFGTTGEGPSFTIEERKRALKELIERGIDPQRIIFGISCCSINDAVELACHAVEQNCSAVMIAPPFFYKNVDDQGVIAYYREIIQQSCSPNIKIFLYHIPQCTGVPMTINVIKTLWGEFPNNVIGIKDSEGNFSFIKEILNSFPGFKVFVGHETQISQAVQLGAAGGISGMANAYPELICSLYHFARDRQKPDNNDEINSILKELKKYPLFPAIKSLVMNKKGTRWRIMRPPLIPLDEKESQTLNLALKEINPA